jgi:hypothetical protein
VDSVSDAPARTRSEHQARGPGAPERLGSRRAPSAISQHSGSRSSGINRSVLPMSDNNQSVLREPPVAGDETATLLGSLERQRAIFAWKCGALDAAGVRATRRRWPTAAWTDWPGGPGQTVGPQPAADPDRPDRGVRATRRPCRPHPGIGGRARRRGPTAVKLPSRAERLREQTGCGDAGAPSTSGSSPIWMTSRSGGARSSPERRTHACFAPASPGLAETRTSPTTASGP